eukprot:Gb_10622 [translate_table: standard]
MASVSGVYEGERGVWEMDGLDHLFCCSSRERLCGAIMAELASTASQESPPSEDNNNQGSSVREQERFLPIANISRIMKKGVPANAKIAKDAKDTVQECVSEFISFITSEYPFKVTASDKCQREKRKTINGDDLLWAMSTLGFEDYVEPLKIYLHKYREVCQCPRGLVPSACVMLSRNRCNTISAKFVHPYDHGHAYNYAYVFNHMHVHNSASEKVVEMI